MTTTQHQGFGSETGEAENETLKRYAALAIDIDEELRRSAELTERAGNGSVSVGLVDPSTSKNTG